MFETSKHSIRSGRLSRLRDSRSCSRASTRRRRRCSAALVSCSSASRAFSSASSASRRFSPALRCPHLDARAAEIAEEGRKRVRVDDVGRDDDLGRDRRRGAVVLQAEGLEDGGAILSLDVLEVEREAVDEPPPTEGEELHRGAVAVRGEPDHVDRPHGALVGGLPLRKALDGAQPVSVARGLLEPLLGRGRSHPLLQGAPDGARLAREELDHPVDDLAVLLDRDRADTGRGAALDVEVEAGDPRMATWLRALAGAELEDAVQDVERLAHLLRVRVRAEVDVAAAVTLSREHHARVLVRHGDRDVREGLVVAEPDVERWAVALHEVLLEMQRLGLALRDDHLDAADSRHEVADALARVAPAVEVAAHTGPEGLRLPDVEDLVARVAKEIDARSLRQPTELAPNGIFTHES